MGPAHRCPASRAIVWQDTRTAPLVEDLLRNPGEAFFLRRCALPPSTYFSVLRIRWLFEHVKSVEQRARDGEVLFGTMESWLLWNLTGGADGGLHLIDATNASRTMLMNIHTLAWDDELLGFFGVPRPMLPEIRPCAERYGEASALLPGIPLTAALGDQQAALFGQTCFSPGEAKCTTARGASCCRTPATTSCAPGTGCSPPSPTA